MWLQFQTPTLSTPSSARTDWHDLRRSSTTHYPRRKPPGRKGAEPTAASSRGQHLIYALILIL